MLSPSSLPEAPLMFSNRIHLFVYFTPRMARYLNNKSIRTDLFYFPSDLGDERWMHTTLCHNLH